MLGLSLKPKDVLSYAFFPRVIPRFKSVFMSGFGYVAFLMAQIYMMVRLLPANHPYVQARNIGRFGIHNVIAVAANNIKFSRKNIDQIFVFVALLAAIVIVIMQLLFLIYGVVIGPLINPAHAFSWFDTPNPTNDLAFSILNDVFGVPDMYCSSFTAVCPANNPPPIPFPFHNALQELFRFYSTALLLIGTLIFLYFVFVLVLETAVTGTPFGQRVQHVWVPIRLVVAIGLLMPQNFGLNSAQYIVLYAAKYGSNMATQGWVDFNTAIGAHPQFGGGPLNGNPTGERYTILAVPQQSDVTSVFRAMTIVHSCAFAYMLLTGKPPSEPAVPYHITDDYTAPGTNFMIKPYLVKHISPWTTAAANLPPAVTPNPNNRELVTAVAAPSYLDAIGFYYGGDIIIRFGEYLEDPPGSGQPVYKDDEGYVAPLCGDIRIPVVDLSDVGNGAGDGGPDYMLEFYYNLILTMWFDDPELVQFARTMVTVSTRHKEAVNFCSNAGAYAGLSGCGTPGFQACGAPCEQNPPFSQFKSMKMGVVPPSPTGYQTRVDDAVRQAWGLHVNNVNMVMTAQVFDRGWAGAGIWYNFIADMNGTFMEAVRALPTVSKYPLVMEQVRSERQKLDPSAFGLKDMFNPTIRAGSGTDPARLKIDRGDAELDQVAVPLQNLWVYWVNDKPSVDDEETQNETNLMVRAINMLLGTTGLANIRGANAHLHPLAQLVAVGKGLVDNAVINLITATGSAFIGGFLGAFDDANVKLAGGAAEVYSSLMEITAFVGLTAGFVLFYVLPFLPFVYFFFAVGSWVKAIFEAMVAVPLWALAHLRIDGDGLPGDAASNGYFLILEIFIRPILSVVGLVAGIVILSAQVRVLNLIWDLATTNLSGFSDSDIFATLIGTDTSFKGTPIDQFFYTIIYTIVCYMLAVASFKLIDKIPDNILRWAGSGVSSFGDIDQDHVESLNRYAATGGMTLGSQAVAGIRGGAAGLGNTLGKLVKSEKGAAAG
ncbi:MAG: DotA/TraY family protein [Alphaproteobacteria bacterium]|nr:DotA/TraY family protein [Alphaproteobacteria bacterium]